MHSILCRISLGLTRSEKPDLTDHKWSPANLGGNYELLGTARPGIDFMTCGVRFPLWPHTYRRGSNTIGTLYSESVMHYIIPCFVAFHLFSLSFPELSSLPRIHWLLHSFQRRRLKSDLKDYINRTWTNLKGKCWSPNLNLKNFKLLLYRVKNSIKPGLSQA